MAGCLRHAAEVDCPALVRRHRTIRDGLDPKAEAGGGRTFATCDWHVQWNTEAGRGIPARDSRAAGMNWSGRGTYWETHAAEGVAAATAGVTVRPSASATAVDDPGSLSPYWRFHQAVAEAQLASWLPREGRLLVDISGPRAKAAQIASAV